MCRFCQTSFGRSDVLKRHFHKCADRRGLTPSERGSHLMHAPGFSKRHGRLRREKGGSRGGSSRPGSGHSREGSSATDSSYSQGDSTGQSSPLPELNEHVGGFSDLTADVIAPLQSSNQQHYAAAPSYQTQGQPQYPGQHWPHHASYAANPMVPGQEDQDGLFSANRTISPLAGQSPPHAQYPAMASYPYPHGSSAPDMNALRSDHTGGYPSNPAHLIPQRQTPFGNTFVPANAAKFGNDIFASGRHEGNFDAFSN
jgi:hypothetical protein